VNAFNVDPVEIYISTSNTMTGNQSTYLL